MDSKCIRCNFDLVERKNYKMMIPIGNPVQIPIEATFLECPNCGQRLFDEKESMRIADFVDETLRKNEKIDVPIGTKVVIVEK